VGRWAWRGTVGIVGAFFLAAHATIVRSWLAEVDCVPDVHTVLRAGLLARAGLGETIALIRSGWYPPGYDLLLSLVFRALGFHPHLFLVVNLLSAALLFVSVYGIGRELAGRAETGLVAAALTLLAPFVTWSLRLPTRDWGIAGLVAACIGLLVRARGRWRTSDGALLGLAVGAALLVKWTAAAFLALPMLLTLATSFAPGAAPRRRAVGYWLAAAAVALLVAAPYYLASPAFHDLGRHVQVDPIHQRYGYALPKWAAIHYLGRPLAVLAIVSLAVLVAAARTRWAGLLLIGWGLVPVLALEALPHRELRHVAPAMAPLVLAVPLALALAPRAVARFGAVAVAALLVVASGATRGGEPTIVQGIGLPRRVDPSCVGHGAALCDTVDAAARASARRPAAVVFQHDEVRNDCVSEEVLAVCALEKNPRGRPRAWTFVPTAEVPPARRPVPAAIDVWILVGVGDADPPAPGVKPAARFGETCPARVTVWGR
jgi:4-amino-4-deoxy-L-arabinose transferase-like glycosyltransferase